MSEERTPPRRNVHDSAYKRIFAHRRSVADLLRGYAGDLARHLDFATLQPLPGRFVTRNLGQRHLDCLWKIQTRRRQWLYLLVLLEFQSTVHPRMALRTLDYTVRILLGLGARELGPGGKHPLVLPVVIHSGRRRWTAPLTTAELFAPVPDSILGYLPRHRYHLIDLGRLDLAGRPGENVVSVMAMLERAESQGRLVELGAALARWLRRIGEDRLLESFDVWITEVIAQRVAPEGEAMRPTDYIMGESEMSTLPERVRKWGDELNQQWLEKGIEKGRREGMTRGRREAVARERTLVGQMTVLRFGMVVAEDDPGSGGDCRSRAADRDRGRRDGLRIGGGVPGARTRLLTNC